MIDKFTIMPFLACVFATIVVPLSDFAANYGSWTASKQQDTELGPLNRFFWPAMAVIAVVLAVRNYSRLGRHNFPPHIICLLAYAAFAGTSVLWAFRPEASFIRFVQQVMILTSIILPAMLAARTADLMRGLFLCFALATILNLFFLSNDSSSVIEIQGGYSGYFLGKNYLGEFSALVLLLSIHEMRYSGLRRVLGLIVAVIAAVLLFFANSKTALGLALLVPVLAGLTLTTGKIMRISPAIVLTSIVFCYIILSSVSGLNMYRLSYILYGDSTFTGRAIIWEFAKIEIGRRPVLGWGYQSFWLVGPDAPSVVEAPGWVKTMPNAHNGYYDTTLELGYFGYYLLLAFIFTTLHAIGRVAHRDPGRAWLLLSLALYIMIHNGLESTWMRGAEIMWVVFVIVAAEIAKYWQRFPLTQAAHGASLPRQISPGASRGPAEARAANTDEARPNPIHG
jgi:O-antigen ligase